MRASFQAAVATERSAGAGGRGMPSPAEMVKGIHAAEVTTGPEVTEEVPEEAPEEGPEEVPDAPARCCARARAIAGSIETVRMPEVTSPGVRELSHQMKLPSP